MIDCHVIPLSFSRFDAAPLDRHSMSGVVHLCGEVHVLLKAVAPPIGRLARFLSAFNVAMALFPRPPVVVRIVAFHLMRGGSRAPSEVRREMKCCFGHG